MTDFGNYLEAAIIDWFDGDAFPAAPSDLYVGLHTGAPSDDGSDNEISTSGTGYSRAQLSTSGGLTQPSSDEFANATQLNFGPATVDWGQVSHFSIWDASSGGNALVVADLNTARNILNGDEAKFDVGELTFRVD